MGASKWERGSTPHMLSADGETEAYSKIIDSILGRTIMSSKSDSISPDRCVCIINDAHPEFVTNRAVIERSTEAVALVRAFSKAGPDSVSELVREAFDFISEFDKKVKSETP